MKKSISIIAVLMVLVLGGSASANDYLVYDPGGVQDSIQAAMTSLGFTFDVSNAATPVTAASLASHKALVVGWSAGDGDYSGLDPSVVGAGVTGNKVLTGHDADFHTVNNVGATQVAASEFMRRAVLFAGGAAAPGILGFPEFTTTPFAYTPATWGITGTGQLTQEIITAITPAGVASGLYSDPGVNIATLSNWGNSYHAVFTGFDPSFSAFELGSFNGGSVVTIGTTVTPIPGVPEPATALLLALGIAGVAGAKRMLKK